MDVYVSCSLTGGRQDQPAVAALVARLEVLGHRVLTAHLAHPEAMTLDSDLDAEAVFARDVAWLRAADAVIAEVTTPSHGVGFEIGLALQLGKPVLCCHRAGTRVSKMLGGHPDLRGRLAIYEGPDELKAAAEAFLAAR